MEQEHIIAPIEVSLIKQELTPERFLRRTCRGNNEIYIVDCNNAPNTLREIGRLREIAFRFYGGGTGTACDLDEFDLMETPCQQLIVWDPEHDLILGGYRFLIGDWLHYDDKGQPIIATAELFHFSEKFIREVMPYCIELGRAFVTLEYQTSKAGAKGLFALDNLWDGLGALTIVYPYTKYYLGKVTIYPTFDSTARDMILHFFQTHLGERDGLITPMIPLQNKPDVERLNALFSSGDMATDYKTLNREVRALNHNIPPLISAYLALSSNITYYGTSLNPEFGNVDEMGILVGFDGIHEDKKKRYIVSFINEIKAEADRRAKQLSE